MSNLVPNTLEIPDVALSFTGQKLNVDLIAPIGGALNWCINETRCSPVLNQIYEDGVMKWGDTSAFENASLWRIPIISDAHTSVKIMIMAYMENGTDNAVVKFTSSGNGLSSNITVSLGTSIAQYETTLTVAELLDGYDDITMSISALSSDPVTILSLSIQYELLVNAGSSIIAKTIVDGVEPTGYNTLKTDRPLTARMLQQYAFAVNTLKNRPRVLFNWSKPYESIAAYTGEPTGSARKIGAYPHSTLSRAIPNDSRDLTAWVRCQKQATESFGYISSRPFVVPSGSGEVWVTLQEDSEAFDLNYIAETNNYYNHTVGISHYTELYTESSNSYLSGAQYKPSDAIITSISIWGP